MNENGTDVLFICDNNRHRVIKATIDGRVLMVLDYQKKRVNIQKQKNIFLLKLLLLPMEYLCGKISTAKILLFTMIRLAVILIILVAGDEPKHLLNAHGICVDNRDAKRPCLLATSRQQNALNDIHLGRIY